MPPPQIFGSHWNFGGPPHLVLVAVLEGVSQEPQARPQNLLGAWGGRGGGSGQVPVGDSPPLNLGGPLVLRVLRGAEITWGRGERGGSDRATPPQKNTGWGQRGPRPPKMGRGLSQGG